MSSSGTYSQPKMYAARIAQAVHTRKTWLRTLAFVPSHDPRNDGSLLGPRFESSFLEPSFGGIVPGARLPHPPRLDAADAA
jgi:hypothetical protein